MLFRSEKPPKRQTSESIPNLASRTLKGKLKNKDFQDQDRYMVNIDTFKWAEELISGDITFYQTKRAMRKKLKYALAFLKDKKIDYFKELTDNIIYYPRKRHWFMVFGDYRIDWWFSKNDSSKLECITLVKT